MRGSGREVGNNKQRERRGRIGQQRVKEECRKSKETRTGETGTERVQDRGRKKVESGRRGWCHLTSTVTS